MVEDDEGKAIVLNEYFTSVFTKKETSKVPMSLNLERGKVLSDITITEERIQNAVDKMKQYEDGVVSTFVKGSIEGVEKLLLKVFRRFLEETVINRCMEKGQCCGNF
jgi:hypothetical protein